MTSAPSAQEPPRLEGAENPVLPYAHALARERDLPRARLLAPAGAGHEPHPDGRPVIADAVSARTGGH